MELNPEKDCETILSKIENHPEKNEFIELYIKGPPDNEGFIWWSNPPEFFKIVRLSSYNRNPLYRILSYETCEYPHEPTRVFMITLLKPASKLKVKTW